MPQGTIVITPAGVLAYHHSRPQSEHAVIYVNKLVPKALKTAIRQQWRKQVFHRALLKFQGMSMDQISADPDLLATLVASWGNAAWSADVEYLKTTLLAASQARGPILECGSGLTTILLGHVAPASVPLVALEHSEKWAQSVGAYLSRYRIDNARVANVGLRDYGEFSWYDADPLTPEERGFSLVICDGPPGDTPGGRYGLLPVMQSHLASGCEVLLDDFHRPSEQETVARWSREFDLQVLSDGASGVCAHLRLGHAERKALAK